MFQALERKRKAVDEEEERGQRLKLKVPRGRRAMSSSSSFSSSSSRTTTDSGKHDKPSRHRSVSESSPLASAVPVAARKRHVSAPQKKSAGTGLPRAGDSRKQGTPKKREPSKLARKQKKPTAEDDDDYLDIVQGDGNVIVGDETPAEKAAYEEALKNVDITDKRCHEKNADCSRAMH